MKRGTKWWRFFSGLLGYLRRPVPMSCMAWASGTS